ncbi:MAG: multicopper oxidase domain-containing protein [Thiobacillus sp.]|nr:multicopper oxidase domain-containing protein [Thiobacillus sp.]
MSTQDIADTSGTAPVCSGRRTFLKGSVATVAAPMILAPGKSEAQVVVLPPSPPVVPWAIELPLETNLLQPVAALDPPPLALADVAAGECGRDDHPRFDQFYVNPVFYELRARENPDWVFNPAYPPQPVWGWLGSDGQVTAPGPTLFARYGRPVIARIYNELPQDHIGYGSPEISTHLHNAHNPSESDGFPGDFFSPLKAGPNLSLPGQWRDHFWPNVYAGFEQFGGLGDPREALGTCFYHDHNLDFTAPNVLKGQIGFYLIYDWLDSGNERDTSRSALRLPSPPYDYPILLQDMRFDANGMQFYDQLSPEGVLGDMVAVNGKIQPVLRVARRKYRLRVVNGGPSRFYFLHIVNAASVQQPFIRIGTDGNLLPRPLHNHRKIEISPAERADIVIDFSVYPIGTELFLIDRQIQLDTRGPAGVALAGRELLKIIVDREPPEADVSRVPLLLRGLPTISAAELASAPVRRFAFDRTNGQWSINNQLFDVGNPSVVVQKGSYEIWELVNPSGGWHHPIHIHLEEGRILSVVNLETGVQIPIPPENQGRRDVYVLPPNTSMRVFLRFRDWQGKYVMHCHNLVHEDHAMMLRFDITA